MLTRQSLVQPAQFWGTQERIAKFHLTQMNTHRYRMYQSSLEQQPGPILKMAHRQSWYSMRRCEWGIE